MRCTSHKKSNLSCFTKFKNSRMKIQNWLAIVCIKNYCYKLKLLNIHFEQIITQVQQLKSLKLSYISVKTLIKREFL